MPYEEKTSALNPTHLTFSSPANPGVHWGPMHTSITPTRTIVITGASSGIGATAAMHLRRTHPEDRLILVGRHPERTKAVAESAAAEHILADFTNLTSVRALAEQLLGSTERIDVLANNAGGIFPGPTFTTDGFERTFQVNHLAPFLLTHLLADRLRDSHAKVVATSSRAHLVARPNLGDLQGLKKFSSRVAYGNAKLANIAFTAELAKRLPNIHTVAFHPGVVSTSFAHEDTGLLGKFYGSKLIQSVGISAEEAGATLAYFIDGTPSLMWESGHYYSNNRRPGRLHPALKKPGFTARHFELSCSMLGIRWE